MHFNRLKQSQPGTQLDDKNSKPTATTWAPPVQSQESPYQLGTKLQMAEHSDTGDEEEIVRSPSLTIHPPAVVPQPTNRRYPSQVRRPPDRLAV